MGDIQKQKALQIRVIKNSEFRGAEAAREREGGGDGGGDTHRKYIGYSAEATTTKTSYY